MRILLIHQYYLEKDDAGGSRFNEMTKVWAEMGHNITVISGMIHYNGERKHEKYSGKLFYIDETYHKNISVIRCHVSNSYNKSTLGRLWGYVTFIMTSVLASFIKTSTRFDVILTTSPPLFLGLSTILISKIKKTPYLFEIRDLWPETAIDAGLVKSKYLIKILYWIEKVSYSYSKKINVLTPAFRDHLITKKNIPLSKIEYVPNACDFELSDDILKNFERNQLRHKFKFEDYFVIIYVGALGKLNGICHLVEVAKSIEDNNILFVCIGQGTEKNKIRESIDSYGLKNFRLLDPVPKKEVFKYIYAADLCTSVLIKRDTFKTIFSNKTFDYMACKRPIIMSIDGISKDLIQQANCGEYAEPENVQSFIEAIYKLKNDSNVRRMGENGFLYAKSKFDRKALSIKYLGILESLSKN